MGAPAQSRAAATIHPLAAPAASLGGDMVASLFPDCASRGPTVGRLIRLPAHGAVTLVNADNYPNYNTTNRLASCNDKKSSGLNIIYKAEDGYVGEDEADIFLIFLDGTAAEWHYLILVK